MRTIVLLAALTAPLAAGRAQSAAPTAPVYFDFQVEKGAMIISGTANVKYPEPLKAAKVAGEVLAQFVVDTNGVADTATFKVLKSTDELFSKAVREALPDIRFTPALVGTKKVKQLVQLPFGFSTK